MGLSLNNDGVTWEERKKVMPAPNMICYQRPQKIRNILVRAKLSPQYGEKNFIHNYGFKISINTRVIISLYQYIKTRFYIYDIYKEKLD